MVRSRFLTLALLGTIAVVNTVGCHSSNAFKLDDSETTGNKVGLLVKNEAISDIDIYVIGDGVTTRIGTVKGLATTAFSIDQTLFNKSDVRVIGTPFGTTGRASTGPVLARAGQTIEFTIGSSLSNSRVNVH